MTAIGENTTECTRRKSTSGVQVLVVCALVSLVLSPITAVWTLLLAPLMLVVGLVVSRLRPGRTLLLVYAGAGLLLGVFPYFLLAVLQA